MEKYVKIYNMIINDRSDSLYYQFQSSFCCCIKQEHISKKIYYGNGNDPIIKSLIEDAYKIIIDSHINTMLSEVTIECQRGIEPNIKPGFVACSFLLDTFDLNNIIIWDSINIIKDYNGRIITIYFWKL